MSARTQGAELYALATPEARNPGMAFDRDLVLARRANTSAIERRAATLPGRRSVKGQWQAAWLLRAVTCIDLTTLAGDDTPGRVQRLCAKAAAPVRPDLLEAMEMEPVTVGAVCVYHEMIEPALRALEGIGHSRRRGFAGFPAGQSSFPAAWRRSGTALPPARPRSTS